VFGRGCGSEDSGRWAAGRRGRGPLGGLGFGGGRHGFGGGDFVRAGRMLAHGDLRLLSLALIAEQPRHGYDIIKVLEEKTAGWYSPSPGVVYPALTYLEEAGYITGQAEGSRKLYTVTDEGRTYLALNRDFVDAVLERLAAFGEKVACWRRSVRGDDDAEGPRVSRLIDAAIENLRDVAAERFRNEPAAEAKIVAVLVHAATDLRSQ